MLVHLQNLIKAVTFDGNQGNRIIHDFTHVEDAVFLSKKFQESCVFIQRRPLPKLSLSRIVKIEYSGVTFRKNSGPIIIRKSRQIRVQELELTLLIFRNEQSCIH